MHEFITIIIIIILMNDCVWQVDSLSSDGYPVWVVLVHGSQ